MAGFWSELLVLDKFSRTSFQIFRPDFMKFLFIRPSVHPSTSVVGLSNIYFLVF